MFHTGRERSMLRMASQKNQHSLLETDFPQKDFTVGKIFSAERFLFYNLNTKRQRNKASFQHRKPEQNFSFSIVSKE